MPYLSNAQRKAIWARRNAADKEVVIDNAQTKQKLTKGDVGQYYGDPRIREELIKSLRNRDLLAVMSRNPDKHIFKRYEAKNKPLRVQGEEDLSRFVTRRYTEFHPTIGEKTKEIWVDIDSGKDLTTGTLKPLTQEVSTAVKQMPEVASTNIAFSGGDGFYVRGLLKRTQNTARMRSRLKEELAELVKKHKHVTMGPPGSDEVRLDISTLHNKGSIRAPYSLNAETGLVSIPVTSKQLPTFKPTRDALPENVIKNLKYFAPGIPKTKVTQEIPSQKEQSHWTLAVQEHKAQRAGKHWDVRLVDPNTGYAHSWAVPKGKLPADKPLLAIQQPTHTADYALNFGLGAPKTIGKGYGKGTVEIKHKEPVKVLKSTPDYVKFERLEDGVPKNYMLIRTKDTSWIMKKGSTMKKTAGQVADEVLYKAAVEGEITPEDIAAGLAGRSNRDIPYTEVDDYIRSQNQTAIDNTRGRTGRGALWGGGIGGGLGAGWGALAGGSGGMGLKLRDRLGLAALSSLVGGGTGAGIGALSGAISGRRERNKADRYARFYSQVAQQGRMPADIPDEIDDEDLIAKTRAISQGETQEMDPYEREALRKRLQSHMMTRRALEGALHGATWGDEGSTDAIEEMARGALSGASEAKKEVSRLADLRSRGYGHLADRFESRAMQGAFSDY